MDVTDFVDRYMTHQNEDMDGRDFVRDLVELIGSRADYDTYVAEMPVTHVERDMATDAELMDSTGRVDFYSEALGVVLELKSGDFSIASSRDEFSADSKGEAEWNRVLEHRPRAWDVDRRVTPYVQAKGYADDLVAEGKPVRFIVVSNFREIRIYEYVNGGRGRVRETEEIISLADVPDRLDRLAFMARLDLGRLGEKEAVSRHAGELVKQLRDHVIRCWKQDGVDVVDGTRRVSMGIFLLRVVFILFAESSRLFGVDGRANGHEFADWVESVDADYLNEAFTRLFTLLDTPDGDRSSAQLRSFGSGFCYVNGSVFSNDAAFLGSYGLDGKLELPVFDEKLKRFVVDVMSRKMDWSDVDPTVFGSIFESLVSSTDGYSGVNKRREQGIHYTSRANIHKVIGPLFLDDLEADYELAMDESDLAVRARMLYDLMVRLGGITILDPACGSGNFLTESYRCLRDLENRAVTAYVAAVSPAMPPSFVLDVKVCPSSFYGIELDPLAGAITCLAMNRASSQCGMFVRNFPLESGVAKNIRVGVNAINDGGQLCDWRIDGDRYADYVVGNPPFIGPWHLDDAQKKDRGLVFGKSGNVLDYVSCWFEMASRYVEASGNKTRVAFVATNSICQGQQVIPLWRHILEGRGQEIKFVWTSFKWDSESMEGVAAVTVVVIGIGAADGAVKHIISDGGASVETVNHVNAYLMDFPDVWVQKRSSPIVSGVPEMRCGFLPADNGYLRLEPNERDELLRLEPQSAMYVRRAFGSKEVIKGEVRYCLWLVDADLDDLKANHPLVWSRVQSCGNWRRGRGTSGEAYKLRDVPHLMRGTRHMAPGKGMLALPQVSGENRKYTPIDFLPDYSVPTNLVHFVSGAGLYEFGIVSSYAYHAFTDVVSGKLEDRQRHCSTLVYNNFPWPSCDDVRRRAVEDAAKLVLEARRNHADKTLAQMYDGISSAPASASEHNRKKYDLVEYADLAEAHKALDAAVDSAYGVSFSGDEEKMLRHLLKLWIALQ